MRSRTTGLAAALALSLLAASLACREDAEPPAAPEGEPALATTSTATLSLRLVSSGSWHTCGVTTDDRAYCWGDNSSGQLGDGSNIRRLTPVPVAGGLRFLLVSAGDSHTCGVTTDNRPYCWGSNKSGELGDGTTASRLTPVAVSGGRRFLNIRAGAAYTCGVNPFNVAFCWGDNRWSQLGRGVTGISGSSTTPVRVAGGLSFRRVIPAFSHTCGVTTDDRGYCWGKNSAGQLGNGTHTDSPKPVPVAGGLRFRQVYAASGFISASGQDEVPDEAYGCGVTRDDLAYCWGVGTVTNVGSSTPKRIEGRHFPVLSPGGFHACGLNPYDVAFCWGNNAYGQLGIGGTSTATQPPPGVRVAGGLHFVGLTTSVVAFSSCGVTAENRVYCWGNNSRGQVGDGSTTDRFAPVPVAGAN